ncbi:hypothetical protein Leryth_019695 [Lithospermum erythrorhizon]|nr:hypothetical protein Leryth_019695 [Lithospermum erythrorhizon]
MKIQTEPPLGKQQQRRKAPKIGSIIIVLALFCTLIPIYYPTFLYSTRKLSQTIYSSNHVIIEDGSIKPTSDLEEDDPIKPTSSLEEPLSQENEGSLNKPSKQNNHDSILWLDDPRLQDHVAATKKPRRGKGKKRGGRKTPRQSNNNPQKSAISNGGLDILASHVSDVNENSCDIFSGEWVPDPDGPYYTNMTCKNIQEHQNCMKFGRPDKDYLKWKWKPDGCELPLFDPHQFFELVRGKSLAFVGDSVARNHMQSLVCLLSRVTYPIDISEEVSGQNTRWIYPDYDFNISMFWSPYLVRTEKTDPNDVTKPFNLFLDEFDDYWRTRIESYDYVIISAGHWFFRPTMFYLNKILIGCLYCQNSDVKHLNTYFSYRRAFRTALNAINCLDNFKGVTFLRTFAPSHFEGGPWDKGGDCRRTQPYKRSETELTGYNLEMYKIQLDELRIAQRNGRRKGVKFKLFDGTRTMLLRPDGHPSKYGHSPNQTVALAKDCVHWCLPGPLDTWNDFLQELIVREIEQSSSSFV